MSTKTAGANAADVVSTLKNSLAKPIQAFNITENGKNQQVQSLSFYKNLLIVGTNTGKISGYSWYKNRLAKKTWEIFLANQNIADQNDMNCFWLYKPDGTLFVGCGDNHIYAVNLETGKILRNFNGHTDYVHWIDGANANKLYSASEDGSVKFWDQREKRFVNQLEPYKDGMFFCFCFIFSDFFSFVSSFLFVKNRTIRAHAIW